MRGKPAVARIAGKYRMIAEIFAVLPAIGANAAGCSKPGDADAFAKAQRCHTLAQRIDTSDNLVTRHNRIGNIGQFPVDHMEIGAAHAAGANADADHAGTRIGLAPLTERQRLARRLQYHDLHSQRPLAETET